MSKYPQVLVNVKVSKRIDLDQSKSVQSAVREVEDELKDTGRVLLRYSGTEPLIRVMIEGRESKQVHRLADQLAAVVKTSIV
jgi:phosphoglucosamine mutase